MMDDNQYGAFADSGREYVITERKTPRHWYNYFFNDTYNGFASQVGYGEGIVQDRMGNRIFLVSDRCLYITDKESGTWHTANGLPVDAPLDFYECRHGIGYSTMICEAAGIRSELTLFVPQEGNFEQWIVTITNKRGAPASLSTIAYCATETDHSYRAQGYNSDAGYFDPDHQAVYTRIISKIHDDAIRVRCGYLISDGKAIGYDARKNGFIGTYGTKDAPQALMERNGCANTDCVTEKLCYALETECRLEAGESRTICYQMGFLDSKEELPEARKTLGKGIPQRLLEEVRQARLREMDGVTIQTPDEMLNAAFNHFYKYATNMGSRWARVRHNGYRDIMSDTECLGVFNPEYAWQRFVRALEYQYSNGYAPRTFLDGKVHDHHFSDCAVWISFTCYYLLMELGDLSLLEQPVAYNDGTVSSVYEHVRRSVEFLYHFKGQRGLIKIWGGDWNDGMNRAGLEGKGESVWLSIAWYRANKMLMEMARLRGDFAVAEEHGEMGEAMRRLIEEHGWDGEYYLTAINDAGEKIGSRENAEGSMYLNPQLWAVFADIAPREKLVRLMEEVDRKLDRPLGTLVNSPAYSRPYPLIGAMTDRPQGVLINGAVYLHPMAWKLGVEGIMKRADKVQQTLEQILPWNRKWAPTVGEPYVLFNFYHGPEAGYRCGTPGQSWRTATTAWTVKSLVNYVFGLVPCMEGLKLDPCLPLDWKECSITKVFRGCTYVIHYHQQGQDAQQGSMSIKVDGREWKHELLPYERGKQFTVDVIMAQ